MPPRSRRVSHRRRHRAPVQRAKPAAEKPAEPKPPASHHTSTALVVVGGKVLLGLRTSRERFAGMWDAFGGHIEEGETPAHALVRELYEELGVRVTGAKFLHEYEDTDPTSHETFHHHLYLVTAWQGRPRIANPEHSEFRLFTAAEAADLNLQPHLKAVIADVLAKNV